MKLKLNFSRGIYFQKKRICGKKSRTIKNTKFLIELGVEELK